MDERNGRSPRGVWTPFEQTWESNRSVRMENVGETDLVNPWLSNGHNDFRSTGAIVARAIEPGMTDREKAIALWTVAPALAAYSSLLSFPSACLMSKFSTSSMAFSSGMPSRR